MSVGETALLALGEEDEHTPELLDQRLGLLVERL
jgi:hypothetical protein